MAADSAERSTLEKGVGRFGKILAVLIAFAVGVWLLSSGIPALGHAIDGPRINRLGEQLEAVLDSKAPVESAEGERHGTVNDSDPFAPVNMWSYDGKAVYAGDPDGEWSAAEDAYDSLREHLVDDGWTVYWVGEVRFDPQGEETDLSKGKWTAKLYFYPEKGDGHQAGTVSFSVDSPDVATFSTRVWF